MGYRLSNAERMLDLAELKLDQAKRRHKFLPLGRIKHLMRQAAVLKNYLDGVKKPPRPKRKGIPARIPNVRVALKHLRKQEMGIDASNIFQA